MAVAKLLNLIALSSLAILACSFAATPVSALSLDTHHLAARSPNHSVLAKKKRSNNSKRCKARPAPSSSSTAKPTTTTTHTTSTKTSTKAAAATTTKASSSSSSSSSSSAIGGPGKVGLGWPQDDNTALAHFKTDNVSPVYTWSPWIPTAASSLGFVGVPMLWGDKQISDFASIVVEGYADVVLGFNEPNQQGQSDMTPAHAASVWQEYIQPLKAKGYSLISPAVTNAASGKTWLQQFFTDCSGCTFDGIALHFYGTDPQAFISYLEDMHSTFNQPLWITEYACENFSGGAQCTSDDVWNWMTTTKSFMDSTSWVAHYFAFGAMYDMGNVNPLNQLLASNGYPTDLGYAYIN